MKILNLGSLNFDRVYAVDQFVSAGQTILSTGYEEFMGGKGLNQSIALAKGGAQVYHAGAVGSDGAPLMKCLEDAGVDTSLMMIAETASGHAVIQNAHGQNCIIVCGGANQCLTEEYIDRVLSNFAPGDLLLLQNEVNLIPYAMEKANSLGMKIAFNASPITPALLSYPLNLVDFFLVNEIEGKLLGETDADGCHEILKGLCARYPNAAVVMTLGKDGVMYADRKESCTVPGIRVTPVDTTAAGDTFTGFFLAALAGGADTQYALQLATKAAAISVTRSGAAPSIPTLEEAENFSG